MRRHFSDKPHICRHFFIQPLDLSTLFSDKHQICRNFFRTSTRYVGIFSDKHQTCRNPQRCRMMYMCKMSLFCACSQLKIAKKCIILAISVNYTPKNSKIGVYQGNFYHKLQARLILLHHAPHAKARPPSISESYIIQKKSGMLAVFHQNDLNFCDKFMKRIN